MRQDWEPSAQEDVDDDGEVRSEQDGDESTIHDILNSLFRMQAGGHHSGGSRVVNLSGIAPHDFNRLLNYVRGRRQMQTTADNGDDDEGDEDDEEVAFSSSYRDSSWFEPVIEPQQAGVELIDSGDFGRIANRERVRRNKANIPKFLSYRSCQPTPHSHREDYYHNLLPNSNGTAVACYDANIYTGQYSADSSFYYTCSKDFRLHIFDTTAPPEPYFKPSQVLSRGDVHIQTTMKIKKTIQGSPGRWTITDANLSPDNERMIYSSITPTVYMTNVMDGSAAQIPISFADPPRRSSNLWGYDENFGIWSCRFSADGNEVVAGGDGYIFVYDLLANRRTVKISAHRNDVNSCCWADTTSGNVLVSASDDTFLKVWDRRSLGVSQNPSGVLIGHTEGITYVSAKGDGRYVISNGKDQALRLWDLRKMRSSQEFERVQNRNYGFNFDYRYPDYPKPKHKAHPLDCSVMTYRGHSVLRTLIRCHFSPLETTGAQYLYSGSADGKIHIWSLDGRIVQVLDRSKTLPMSFDPSEPEPPAPKGKRPSVCVRDVSWHSQEPVLMSAGWENGLFGSIVARHEWKGLGKMGGNLETWIEKNQLEQQESQGHRSSPLRQAHMPGTFDEDSDDE